MKINKITNAQEFFKVVDDCKGRVELLTGEWFRFLFITMSSKEAASGRFCRCCRLHIFDSLSLFLCSICTIARIISTVKR